MQKERRGVRVFCDREGREGCWRAISEREREAGKKKKGGYREREREAR